ncbi:MAG: hypothetical protein R3C10_22550 [Pirellulales bacterium]
MRTSRTCAADRRGARRCWTGALVLALPVLLGGCGESGPPMGTVTGTVTVDNEPAQTGSIAFFPTDGVSPTAGAAIEGGRYTATVPVGKSKVEVRVSKIVGHQKLYDTPDSPTQAVMEEVLPARYNDQTELEFDVSEGDNEKNFDLSSENENE